MHACQITNTVILSGDSHANWVSDLARPNDTTTWVEVAREVSTWLTTCRYNMTTGAGAIGVEFAGERLPGFGQT
jgi:alkaline phosphatase D